MLAIDEAMTRIQQIQQSIAISTIFEVRNGAVREVAAPAAYKSVKRAYLYWPPASESVSDLPCFINQWTAPDVQFASGVQRGEFSVHMQLLVAQAATEADRSAAIASAYYPQIVKAFAENLKLDGWRPATVLRLRGGDPTLATLTFGVNYVGLDLYLDIALNAAQLMSA